MTYQYISQDPELSKLQRILFKDGMQYSINMANLSYSRLRADLLALSKHDYSLRKENKETLSKEEVHVCKISALTNAWQVVDSVNRLRELLKHAPGINHETEYKLFFRQTDNVKHLRNNIQHLNTHILQFIQDKLPAWGNLAWASKLDESDEWLLFAFVPGEIFEREVALINPAGKKITIPIGIITLISDKEVCLSDLVEIQVSRITSWLQKTQGIDFSSPAQSMFASMVFTPNKTNSPGA